MLKSQKQISFILLLVFTFPVVYQQVHLLHHHALSNTHVCCEHHHCSQISVEPVSTKGLFYSNKSDNETCVICDYKFTINQMPIAFDFGNTFNYFGELSFTFNNANFICSFTYSKPSRAPPVFSMFS